MNGQIIEILPADAAAFLSKGFLWDIYQWGIAIIRVIQEIKSPALTAFMKFITALGTETLYLPLILFILWWIDEKQGLRLGILVILSAWINSFIKDLWKQPRPYHLDPSLGLVTEHSYGAPSGHSQMSMTFWLPMAAWLSKLWPQRRKIIWTSAIFFVLLIAFTRLYLGAHFPTDVFTGWFFAGIIITLFFVFHSRLENLLTQGNLRSQNLIIAFIALLMTAAYARYRILPAIFLGFCLGYTMMKNRFPFSARGEINGKKPGIRIMFFRCLTGFMGTGIIFLGLRLIFPGEGSLFGSLPVWGSNSPFYEIGHFLRYGALGFWASAGAPWIFQRMGLAASNFAADKKDENSPGAGSFK